MNEQIRERAKHIPEPSPIGSYSDKDCVFLLKELIEDIEIKNEDREKMIQSGIHYSEMLPVEYIPKPEYVSLFHESLNVYKNKLSDYVGIVAEKILNSRKNNSKELVLVSLARAGSPIGVLIKRYIEKYYNVSLPHYSISIIRGKGFDENALCYILNKHNSDNLIFIDGWTGKGAITQVLKEACDSFNEEYKVQLDSTLAVLADPAKCVSIYGTREDFLIPSACLNSTVSGLTTRSVERKDLIGEYEFHGAKYYKEWGNIDLSNYYVNVISECFSKQDNSLFPDNNIPNSGMKEIENIITEFGVSSIHHIKPSVGECTRVLLRRVPDVILVKDIKHDDIKHLILLAKDRNVEVMEYPNMSYTACGIIKTVSDSME